MADVDTDAILIAIKAQNEASAALQQVVKDLGGVDKATETTSKNMKEMSDQFAKSMTQLRNVGLYLSATVTAPLTLFARKSILVAQEFEQGMTNTFVRLGEVTEQTQKQLSDFARSLGRENVEGSVKVAKGMTTLADAGRSVKEIMQILPNVMNLTEAAGEDMGKGIAVVNSVMTSFNIKAEDTAKIADVLVSAVFRSKLTFDQLQTALVYAGPVMTSYGKTLEETTATLALFSNAGMNGARAGYTLRIMMQYLNRTTPQMQKALQDMGIALNDVNPAMHTMGEILDNFQKAGAGDKSAL